MKNTKLSLLALLLLAGQTALQAGRPLDNPGLLVKTLEWFEQSALVCKYNDYLAKQSKPNTQGKPVPADLLEQIKRAQDTAGIPAHRHVVVDRLQTNSHHNCADSSQAQDQTDKWIIAEKDIMTWAWKLDGPISAPEQATTQNSCDKKDDSEFMLPTAAAHTEPGLVSLYANFENFPKHEQNHIINHEIDHIKRNAGAMCNIIDTAPLLRLFLLPKYRHFFEQRADIKGAYATQCWCCVSLSAKDQSSKETRAAHLAKVSRIQHKLQTLSDQEKVNAYLTYAQHHWPQHMEEINALSEKNKISWARDFIKNQAIPRIAANTRSVEYMWHMYVQSEGFNVIAGQLLHENEQNVCAHHTEQMEKDSEFKADMLDAKTVITSALEEYHQQQDKTLTNRSKKLVKNSMALAQAGAKTATRVVTHTAKLAAQPRTALPNNLLKINKPII
jgi:hypothetical protein